MVLYVKHKGLNLWDIIESGPVIIGKSKDRFTNVDYKLMSNISKAMHILYCSQSCRCLWICFSLQMCQGNLELFLLFIWRWWKTCKFWYDQTGWDLQFCKPKVHPDYNSTEKCWNSDKLTMTMWSHALDYDEKNEVHIELMKNKRKKKYKLKWIFSRQL